MKKTNIIFAGEGGQGVQTIAKIFSMGAFKHNLEVSIIPSFGVEQRGTPSVVFLSIDSKPLRYPKFLIADLVVVLQNRAIKAVAPYVSPATQLIFDSSTIACSNLPKTAVNIEGIPATKYASTKFNAKAFNMIILGYLSKLFDLPQKLMFDTILEVLGKKFKDKEVEAQNKEAFIFGYELISEKKEFSKAVFSPKKEPIIYRGYSKTAAVIPSRCKGCGICIVKCPVAALSFSEELGIFATPVPKTDLERCIACGNCRNYCPDGAINVVKDKQ